MFDIGWGELLLIGVVALIAIGPKELPGALRTLGQWMAKLRRMASEFQNQFHEAMREAEMVDLKKQVDEMTSQAQSYANFDPISDVRRELEGTQQQIESAITAEPAASASAPASPSEPGAAPPALSSPDTQAAPPSAPAGEPGAVEGAVDHSTAGSKPA
jgi:sec-independent protein translocase protein TatB